MKKFQIEKQVTALTFGKHAVKADKKWNLKLKINNT